MHSFQSGLRFKLTEGSFLDKDPLEIKDHRSVDENFVADSIVVEQNRAWLQFANIQQKFGKVISK